MISSLDQGIGRILQTLDEKGIADNTLVWFFSDNGGVGAGDNRPLRAGKATVFEGGIRVAAALRWPAKVPAGGKITTPTASIDVLPTLMQIAGVEQHGGKPLDGLGLADFLTGKGEAAQRDLYSYIGQSGEDNEQITLIEPQWKLVVIGRTLTDPNPPAVREIHLFRIVEDPVRRRPGSRPSEVVAVLEKLKTNCCNRPTACPTHSERPADFVAPKEWRMPEGSASNANSRWRHRRSTCQATVMVRKQGV